MSESSPPAVNAASGRIPALDGVRGVAILMVLFFHGTSLATLTNPVAAFVQRIFQCGWAGVDLFFVLSGFLITRVLLAARAERQPLSWFYIRRALRIFPVYYATIAAAFLVVPLFISVDGVPGYRYLFNHQVLFWTYTQNWMFAHFGRVSNFPWLQHLWSLAIEEQFYLLWPAAVWFLPVKFLGKLCLLVIVGCLGFRLFLAAQGASWLTLQVHTFARFDSLMFGALASLLTREPLGAQVWRARARAAVGPLAALAVLSFFLHAVQTVGYSVLGALFAALILLASAPGVVARGFDRPVLRAFGKYSYAIYVFHWPLYLSFNFFYERAGAALAAYPPALVLAMNVVAGTALSFAAAWISWNTLEKKCLEMKSRFA